MSDSEQLELAVPAHNNQNLFSDHYLNENLPSRAQWQALREEARPMMDEIAAVLAGFSPSDNERQTEENLVIPILKLLGHTFEVQASLKTPDGAKTPDYVFYASAAAVAANKNKVLTDALPDQGGVAVGDAKYWNRPLDTAIRQTSGDWLSNRNPSYQMYFYMLHSGVTWGILTNGRRWRLYHKDTAHKLDHFYEVDLAEAIESGDVGRFLYFYAFFRRQAFDDGPLSIGAILRESADYARNVGNSLKDQVYDALRHIAQGFLDYSPNGLRPDSDALAEIYDSSLILLYRLIFILYAEARELLPVRESQPYRDAYSFHAVKHEVARDLSAGKKLLPSTALLWPHLQTLFQTINLGSPPLNVATFNGGLFDPERHAFLTRYVVGDSHLQQAIDKLARVDGAFVDYRDLAVQHMGTIYEGLLEYRIQPLDSPEGGWSIELVNDKGERKATGSYYTPDYIVKYIVEQAVGPALERAIDGKATDADKLQAVLDVNVLDPAMGSGHFLVEATEYIARYLVDLGLLPEGKTAEEADLAFWKRRVVQSCVYGVDLNPLAVELAKLSLWLTTVAKDRPLSFLDHHLRPGNSLIGARIENLEIQAKKSSRKRGADKAQAAGQVALFEDSAFTQRMSSAVGSMWLIETNDAMSVNQVKEQERIYEELRAAFVGKYSRLLNLVTASQLGLTIDGWLRDSLIKYVLANGGAASFPKFDKVLQEADVMAERERFFHWELEFPEVFFDKFGRPLADEGGFEAVVGNPPYVEHRQLASIKPYLETSYPQVYDGVADLYTYFFARGVEVLQRNGLLAFISSGMFRRLKSGVPLRRHLATHTTIKELIDLSDQQVFAEAVTYPVIAILAGQQPSATDTLALRKPGTSAFASVTPIRAPLPSGDEPWIFLTGGLRRVVDGFEGATPLRAFVGSRICRGITTGYNEAFVISQEVRDELVRKDPNCAELIKPFVRGEDLLPWYQHTQNEWLIVVPHGWTRTTLGPGLSEKAAWQEFGTQHPGLAKHLSRFAKQAKARWDKGEFWWELRPCDYYSAFELPRIHSTKVSLHPAFSISQQPVYAANTSYVIPLQDIDHGYFLLGLLNSRVCEYFCRQVFSPKANGYYEVQPEGLERFPIPASEPRVAGRIAEVARVVSNLAERLTSLRCAVRHRIHTDLGTPGSKLNQKLTTWWGLDFPGLRAELKKALKTDIPVGERDQWEAWFAEQRAEHQRLTDEIINLETELNDRVYALFKLTPDEIKLIEESTKYKYGEV